MLTRIAAVLVAHMLTTFVLLIVIVVLVACSDGDGDRRDRDEPRAEPPVAGNVLAFDSTTGENVKEEPDNTFHIPACGKGKLGYVTTRWTTPLRATAMMRVGYTVTASADAKIVGHERRSDAGRMALHFQRKGDDGRQAKLDQGYRQWSTARKVLAPGDHVFEVQLVPQAWGNRAGFSQALLQPENAGVTLSDNQSAGHGVCMAAGTASLAITSFTAE